MTTSIDTLSIAERLKAAGASQKLAREHAEIFREITDEHLCTKRDLRENEQRIVIRLGSLIVIATAFLASIKFFG